MKTENLNIEYHTELYVYEALRRTGGNMKEASVLLGCNLRTLFRYVKNTSYEKSMKELLNKVYEDGRVFAKTVPFESYFNDEKALVRLCNRDRDANGIEND